ncbi:MAG: DUF2807 domain-containing protein [Anaerolineaceae bacterium]|nr:DUF2807 domain-containing protein [Anaerolineaceae bacterium]
MDKKQSVFNWQLFLGLVLVLAGGIFLADLFLPFNLMRLFWPVLIILFGLTFLIGMLFAGRNGSGLAIPGVLITTLGCLFFVQNTFHLWVTWTYAWALLISAVGLGLLVMNIYHKRTKLRRAAGLIIGIGLTLFVLFGIFFEVILNLSGTGLYSGIFLGAGLIMLGLFVVFSRPLFSKSGRPQAGPIPATDGMTVEGEVMESTETPNEMAGEEAMPGEVQIEGEEYSRLTFKSVGEIFLMQGEACSLEIKGNPDLIERVKTNIQDGELSIVYDVKIKDWSDLQILGSPKLQYYITMKDIEAVKMGGAGNLEAGHLEADKLSLAHNGLGKMQISDLHCQDLTAELSGLGEIFLKGAVQTQTVDLTGAGSYDAVGLESRVARVSLSGAGSANVWVEETLDASVSGAGSIRYKGQASVTQNRSGLGDIKPM